jgi:two-component system, NarL family, nitrate/nitrite sensor histidine kinase NarX
MLKDYIHSTVFKIAALMFSISFLAIVSMFSSVFISDSAQSDALAVNVAGSLRMQSFRLLSQLQGLSGEAPESLTEDIKQSINSFETDLTRGVLSNQILSSGSDELAKQHGGVFQQWHQLIQPAFNQALETGKVPYTLPDQVQSFVDQIDALVSAYQHHAENNIALIRLIQTLSLFCTIIIIAFAMLIVNRQIERPLSRLIDVARQISRGDFTGEADESGKGELAILAQAFNKMSRSIYRSQSQLEMRVKEKTKKLENSKESIQLLYHLAKNLNEFSDAKHDFAPILKQLADVTGVVDLDLCIMTANGKTPYEHLLSSEKILPEKCIEKNCEGCTEHDTFFPSSDKELKYPLVRGNTNYGVLVCHPKLDQQLDDWQHQLFVAVAEQVATGLSMREQHEQSRRIALMTERTVIARELHDSLAQALSYLKIQVSRLQKLQDKGAAREKVDEVVGELKGGLSSAYRELRELLTTFRLKIDAQTLKASFEQSIESYKSRSDAFTFNLNFKVGDIPFSPQEEIHLLQIAREAMQNAYYHSKGNVINVSVMEDQQHWVSLQVSDNGIGIGDDPNKLNHYGLAIMQERSRSLNGKLSIVANQSGGTNVSFSFKPEYAKDLSLSKKSA